MNIFENRNCLYTTTINISRGDNSSEIKIASKQGHPIFKGSESATWVCVSVPWGPFLHCTDAITLPILLENFDINFMYTCTANPQELMIKIYVSKHIYHIMQYCNCQPPTKSPRYSFHTILSRPRFASHLWLFTSSIKIFTYMKRTILQFQFVWPMEGGHLRRELCFYMTSVYKIMWMIQLYSYPEASSYDPILIFSWI